MSECTILLVDDDDAVRGYAATVLEREGFTVLRARHSDEALLESDGWKGPIHVLLTDVRMDPYLDGCELAKCMRLLRPEIQILYISGNPGNQVVQQEVLDARASFLPKPFSPSQLVESVRAVMASIHETSG